MSWPAEPDYLQPAFTDTEDPQASEYLANHGFAETRAGGRAAQTSQQRGGYYGPLYRCLLMNSPCPALPTNLLLSTKSRPREKTWSGTPFTRMPSNME